MGRELISRPIPLGSWGEGTHNDEDNIQTTLKLYKDDKRILRAKTELSGS